MTKAEPKAAAGGLPGLAQADAKAPPAGKMGGVLPMPMPATPMSARKLARWSYAVVGMAPLSFAASTLLTLAASLLTQYSIQLLADILSALQGRAAAATAIRGEAFLYAAIAIALIAMQFGGRVLTGWSDTQMTARLQQALHDKLLRLGAAFHDKHEQGEMSFVVLQCSGGAQQMLRELASFPFVRGVPLVTATLLLIHNLRTLQSVSFGSEAIIALVLLSLPVVGARLASMLRTAATASQQAQRDLAAEFVNSAAQPLEVQVLGAQAQRSNAFARRLRLLSAAKLSTTIRMSMATQFQTALPTLVEAAFLVYAVLVLVESGSAATGSIIAIYYFVPQVLSPVQDLLGFSIGLSASWPVIAPVGDLLDTGTGRTGGAVALAEGNAVALDGVGLRYGEGRLILDHLSHAFAPGCITAIVGRSGVGKSSILGLLNGMREPTFGAVTLAGVPVGAVPPDALRQRVVTVSQFPLFVGDTMRANFQLARADATDAEIEAVCRRTGLWEVLVAGAPAAPLDAAMSRVAGQGLSGGERRLFAITRALLCRPAVLLLDEPTTGIDRLAVQSLAELLPELLAGLTVIMVEHDMSFVERMAAQVCCLEDGRFAEVGSPAELSARPSLFARLKSAQQSLGSTDTMTIQSIPLPSLYPGAKREA